MNTIQVAELPNNLVRFELAFSYTPLSIEIWFCKLHTKLAKFN